MELQDENQKNLTNVCYAKAQEILKRLKALGKKQKHVAKRFNRSKGRVSQAFSGQAPEFLARIEKWVAQLEEEKALKNKQVA